MKIWKRNAVVAAIVLFVCAAVYLNWSYSQNDPDVSVNALPTGKLLGGAAMVGVPADPGDGSEADQNPAPAATEDAQGQSRPSNDYFSNARINRQQARDSALSLLEEAAANNETEQTIRNEANASIRVMADCTIAESEIEGLVMAKGYADCVAFVGADSASVVVSLEGCELTDVDTAKIMEIAMEQTGLEAGQIKIIPVE